MLEAFRVAKFRFTVCAQEQIRFPAYKGAAFRGGFGYAFKRVVCVIKGKTCDDCLLKQKCIYSYIFETPPPEDAEMLRLYPKVTHPFVIEPPIAEKQSFAPGETFSFHVILVGNAIDYLPYFIYTFTELGKQGIGQGRGKYELLQVEGIGFGGEIVLTYSNKDQKLTNHYPVIQAQQLNTNLAETYSEVTPQTSPDCQKEHQRSPTFQGEQQFNPFDQSGRQSNFPNQGGLQSNPLYQEGNPLNLSYQGINQSNLHYQEERQSNLPCQAKHPPDPPYQDGHQIIFSRQDRHQIIPPYQGGTKGGVKDASQVNNHHNKITISLVTPLRLRFDGHITDKIEFHVFIRNLLRRISSLSYFHCGEKLEIDFKGLIEKASQVKISKSDIHWFDWKRYSTRQEGWMSLGGVTGTISYEGDLSEFIQLLRLCEYVHVGKGTSFGLGRYEIM